MNSADVMFGNILLGFVLSGMTARAEYLGLKRGRKPSEKSRPLAVARACRRVLRIHEPQGKLNNRLTVGNLL
jgi:hypothetical protein